MRLSSLLRSGLIVMPILGHFALPPMPAIPTRGRRRRYRSGAKIYKPNGKREVARRLRQIQAGPLKVTG